ncbi:hypothetical protein PoB_005513300 [Plakobranchus ocellatus]|uniref:Uncharacterized protein n=1 Tax=Plakobranchus ocellatus TaxID=259542 RepID=A0AAV4C9S2_9GAST|nr:hypothetical protein PoB_005513300 [Plakobranchus ocellatus]
MTSRVASSVGLRLVPNYHNRCFTTPVPRPVWGCPNEPDTCSCVWHLAPLYHKVERQSGWIRKELCCMPWGCDRRKILNTHGDCPHWRRRDL